MLAQIKNVAFFTLDLSRDTSPTYASSTSDVLLATVAQWIRKTIPELFQITIWLINRQSSYENEFLEVSKNSEFQVQGKFCYTVDRLEDKKRFQVQGKFCYTVDRLEDKKTL